MHMHYIELCISEMARTSLYPHATQGSILWSDARMGSDNMRDFDLDCLDISWRSVGGIKEWMDMFLSLPPAKCTGLTFIHIAQLARCLMVLYRLSTFIHPAWDCALVRNTVDLLSVPDSIADTIELISSEVGVTSPDDQFMRLSVMVRRFFHQSRRQNGPEEYCGGRCTMAQLQEGWCCC